MRKKIVLLLILLIIPMIVYADHSNSVSIKCLDSMKVGDGASIDFTIDFKDIKRGSNGSDPSNGFIMYAFEFEYDDSVIDIYDVVAKESWDIVVYKDTNTDKYYLIAELNGTVDSYFCPNKISYCDKAGVSLSFNIKDTDKTSTTIKVTKLGGAFINSDGKTQLTESDVKEVESSINTSHTISLSKYENQVPKNTQEHKIVIEEKKNVNINQEVKKETTETVTKQTNNNSNTKTNTSTTTDDSNEKDESNKAYNNYLKTLEIEGYNIDFVKHQSIYSIEVPVEVRDLKVNAIAEATNAKVEIVGADNLEENNNKIIITVTAENGEEKKYIINIKRIKEDAKEKDSFFEITDEQKKMGLIFAGVIVGIGLIIFIIIRIRDRKIEKGMDKW